ncbi:MAG: ACT domain-containing protein [Spirochaetales bacterium]|nr:ACT domain-containing protein [Spirochaetales bacterium]MBO6049205.1 ACT domain-containing protein [Spirochaetales bacterium]MBO7349278.1 ACT domain-containing protein [Spirochaetales bacterium]MBP5757344.1 ACT domain-containing protein [Spirochaetales bacterium]
MLENYLIVHKSILPEYFETVLKAKHLLEEGKAKNVMQATKMVGISRSTYYKYKDYILEPIRISDGRKAVISMLLSHETGILSHVLSVISQAGASILTITQSLPVHGNASVTITLDISAMPAAITNLLKDIDDCQGVENAKLIAID